MTSENRKGRGKCVWEDERDRLGCIRLVLDTDERVLLFEPFGTRPWRFAASWTDGQEDLKATTLEDAKREALAAVRKRYEAVLERLP